MQSTRCLVFAKFKGNETIKPNDICFIRECIADGYGVEDIEVMSMLTLKEIRKEVSEMRKIGTLEAIFHNTKEGLGG